ALVAELLLVHQHPRGVLEMVEEAAGEHVARHLVGHALDVVGLDAHAGDQALLARVEVARLHAPAVLEPALAGQAVAAGKQQQAACQPEAGIEMVCSHDVPLLRWRAAALSTAAVASPARQAGTSGEWSMRPRGNS